METCVGSAVVVLGFLLLMPAMVWGISDVIEKFYYRKLCPFSLYWQNADGTWVILYDDWGPCHFSLSGAMKCIASSNPNFTRAWQIRRAGGGGVVATVYVGADRTDSAVASS